MRTKLHFLVLILMAMSAIAVNGQMANVVWNYNFPVEDTVLVQLGSIRALTYDDDLLGEGVSAIAVTNYVDNGRVHIFKTVGDNALELVWTSPAPDSLGGNSTPGMLPLVIWMVMDVKKLYIKADITVSFYMNGMAWPEVTILVQSHRNRSQIL